MTQGSLEEALVQYITEMRFSHIPEPALEATKWFLLDTLGVAVAGASAPGCLEVVQLVKDWGGKPESTLWFDGGKVPAIHAALSNSVLIHALDFDDTLVDAGLHANAVVLPAALATAELVGGATGHQFLCALTVGIDVACRLGLAASRSMKPAYLPTSVFGVFGATAAAGKLLGLNQSEMRHALGIAYTQVFGNRQSILECTLTKRILPGLASRDAIVSAQLANGGISGPLNFLTGDQGLIALYCEGAYDVELMSQGLGHRFRGVELLRKSYPCCSGAQGAVLASVSLLEAGSVSLADIERVTVFAPQEVVTLLGRPFGAGAHPQVDAQFNLPYLVAASTLKGDFGIEDIQVDSIVHNDQAVELAKRVRVVPIETEEERNIELPVTVEVVLKDGKKHKKTVNYISGHYLDEDWAQATTSKFFACVKFVNPTISDREIEGCVEAILNLQDCDDVSWLPHMLRRLAPLPSVSEGSIAC